MSIRARSYPSNKKDGAVEDSNDSEKIRATCESAEEGPRAKRSKEGHRRPNGKWEARYRPKSRIKLAIDPLAYRGFDSDRGLHKYEWLAYFETKRQKDEYIVEKKVLFKEAYDRAKNGLLQVPTIQSQSSQIRPPANKRSRCIESETVRPMLSLSMRHWEWNPSNDEAGPSNTNSIDSTHTPQAAVNTSSKKVDEEKVESKYDMRIPIEAAELLLSLKR